jgi:hypothetical protein
MSIAPTIPLSLYLMHDQKLTREIITSPEKVIYILGRVTYYDSTTPQNAPAPYVTTFCIENISWSTNGFDQCPTGNDNDMK